MEVVTIDIITYALCKKLAAGAVSGISDMKINGTQLIITTSEGQELVMTFPVPADGISIVDIAIDTSNNLLCTLSDGNIINAGTIPAMPVPIASKTQLGGVKIGKNLKIDEDGTLNVIGGGTGVSDYTELENKPTLNGIEISGDKTAEEYGIKEDKTYTFFQPIEAKEWTIEHNMNKYPSIIVVDSELNQVIADVQYIDLNTVKIKFSKNFIGQAFLN